MRNKLCTISGIVGMFLIFVAFFCGSSIRELRHIGENLSSVNLQSILLLVGNLCILPFLINILYHNRKIEIRVSGIAITVLSILQIALSLYFVIVHAGVKSNSDYLAMIKLTQGSFYQTCVLIKYIVSFVFLPIFGIFALFLAPEKASAQKGFKWASIGFFACSSVFLIMIALTCFGGLNNALIAISRFNGSSDYVLNPSLSSFLSYNVNGIASSQVKNINDLISGYNSTAVSINNNISLGQLRYANVLLIFYEVLAGLAVAWLSFKLVEQFRFTEEN